jgi:hypothetical protein
VDAHDVLAAKVSEMRLAGERQVVVTLWIHSTACFTGVVKDIHADSVELQEMEKDEFRRSKLTTTCIIVDRRHLIAVEFKEYYV